MTYLLDSDILIDFFNQKPDAISLLDRITEQGTCAVSVLSVTELRAGWSEEQAGLYLPMFYQLVQVLPITTRVGEKAGELRRRYKLQGTPLPTLDLLIAATAIVHNLCIVTRNKKHFPMPEVQLHEG